MFYCFSKEIQPENQLWTGRVNNIDGTETTKPFVGLVSKGRFQNVTISAEIKGVRNVEFITLISAQVVIN